MLKTKNVHLVVHVCGRGVHSLPLNSLLGHISHALSVATGRIPSLFCGISTVESGKYGRIISASAIEKMNVLSHKSCCIFLNDIQLFLTKCLCEESQTTFYALTNNMSQYASVFFILANEDHTCVEMDERRPFSSKRPRLRMGYTRAIIPITYNAYRV